MTRRLKAIALLCLLVGPVTITFWWMEVQRYQLRKEVKHKLIEGLNPEELVLLSFHKEDLAQLKWEHAGEFEFDGEMYDVVETFTKGDSTYYRCWPDKEETKLNRKLAALTQKAAQNEPLGQEQTARIWGFFKQLFPSQIGQPPSLLPSYLAPNQMKPYQTFFDGFNPQVATPPPRWMS